MKSIALEISVPWFVSDDFNEIICTDEKRGWPPTRLAVQYFFRDEYSSYNNPDPDACFGDTHLCLKVYVWIGKKGSNYLN